MRWLLVASWLVVGAGCGGAGAAPKTPEPEPGDDDIAVPVAPEGPVGASGNTRVRTFDEAKRLLATIYTEGKQSTDLYCGCTFLPRPGHGFTVDLAACGYVPARDAARAARIEWEHAVPAAKFGRTFVAWRDGDAKCVDKRGKPFKGRKCARVASAEFARIEADLHNLFPVVGEVNGLRGDLPMGAPDDEPRHHGKDTYRFGACKSVVEPGFFVPRVEVRGDIARATKYMDKAYPERGILDAAHREVMDRWDREDPPDAWEKARNARIAERQGNANGFIQ